MPACVELAAHHRRPEYRFAALATDITDHTDESVGTSAVLSHIDDLRIVGKEFMHHQNADWLVPSGHKTQRLDKQQKL